MWNFLYNTKCHYFITPAQAQDSSENHTDRFEISWWWEEKKPQSVPLVERRLRGFNWEFYGHTPYQFYKKLVSKCIFVMSHAIVIYFKLFLNAGGKNTRNKQVLFSHKLRPQSVSSAVIYEAAVSTSRLP